MPTTSATRPSKLAGPTVRQRNPATVAESSAGFEAWANPAALLTIVAARAERTEIGRIGTGRGRREPGNRITEREPHRSVDGPGQHSGTLRCDEALCCGYSERRACPEE